MAKKVTKTSEKDIGKFAPVMSPDARESQIISLAMDLAEKKIRDGTASSQLICHFLDLASPKEKLRQEMMRKQNDLIDAKTQTLQSAKHIEELYANAINAMKEYSGSNNEDDYTYL